MPPQEKESALHPAQMRCRHSELGFRGDPASPTSLPSLISSSGPGLPRPLAPAVPARQVAPSAHLVPWRGISRATRPWLPRGRSLCLDPKPAISAGKAARSSAGIRLVQFYDRVPVLVAARCPGSCFWAFFPPPAAASPRPRCSLLMLLISNESPSSAQRDLSI